MSEKSGSAHKIDVSIVTFTHPSSFALSHRSRHWAPAWRQTALENLALACLHCNRHKGPNIAGTDANTGEIVRPFHPRVDRWNDHFEWAGAALAGRTAIGRSTIHVLAINHPDFLAMREALIQEQAFRPE